MGRRFNLTITFTLAGVFCFAQVKDKDVQIKMAVQAAPEDQQSGATVLGYDHNGKLVTLKSGSNELICLADDPDVEGVSVVCYHEDLESFMSRGRALRAAGKSSDEIFEIREKEARSGILEMPQSPATLHVLSGADAKYNEATGKVVGARLRYVIYIPFATAQSTGLPLRPMVPGGPWIMDPGTHRAHIMISPQPQDDDPSHAHQR